MDYGSILSMGMGTQSVAESGGQSTTTGAAESSGISFNDMLNAFVSAKNAVPARVSVNSVENAMTDIPSEVAISADSPIIAAVKMLQRADGKTLAALDDLAKASGGEINFTDLTAEELTAMLEGALEGVPDETLGKLGELLEAFRLTGAEKLTPETMFIEPEFANRTVAAAKDKLAGIASDLFPDLYETAEDALADAANFPVQVKLIPLVIVGDNSLTIEIPGDKVSDEGENAVAENFLSLSTDEIFETDKILDQLDSATMTRIQDLLQNTNVSIYEAVRALAAVPAEATAANEDGLVGLTVSETDFFTTDNVLARIAANNPQADMVDEISFTDESKRVLEELQNIVKEVIIKETPAPTVTIKVDPLFEQRFRERILNVYAGETQTENSDDELERTYTIRPEMTAHVINQSPATPIEEIGMQPAPFIGTGSAVAPEMQIGNRILEMKAESSVDGTQEMTVVLRPRELGDVAVKIVTENGVVTVTLTAANADTAKLLDRGALTLTSQLQSGGLNVKEVLTITPSEASNSMGLDFTNGQFQSRDGQQNAGNGQQSSHRALGEEALPGEIDGQFTPDDFIMRRMSLWRSV